MTATATATATATLVRPDYQLNQNLWAKIGRAHV